MKISWRGNQASGLWLGLALAFVAGLALRCYLLRDQVFADDEWHGFYFALGKSPGWLLTHFSIPGATCTPLNFYIWLLGQTMGWSETLLRLPSLVCGLLLLVCPLLAHRFIGTRRTVLLAFLLAISPLLVFYSRICRPYSAVAFLGFAAVLLAARWMQTGSRKSAALFVVTGVMAIYFHLFAVVTVAAPFLAVFSTLAWRRYCGAKDHHAAGPTFMQWLWVGVVMAGLSAALVLPALIHSVQATFFQIALHGHFRFSAFAEAAVLISGTGQPVLAGLFWVAVIAGAVEQFRRNPWLGWMLISLFPLHLLALMLSRPEGTHSAIVLIRYCIPLTPVCLFFAAGGIQRALEAMAAKAALQPMLQTIIGSVYVVALCITGPLPQCYVAPNNFTSHAVYQHHYRIIDWRRSFFSDLIPPEISPAAVITIDEVSPFYRTLGKEPGSRPIVEYPMVIGDHFNLLYYYQHFHRRPVQAGYTPDVATIRGLAEGNIYGNTYIDQVLSLAPDQTRLHFRNFVNMYDLAKMRERKVEYVVLHKRFESQLPQFMAQLPDLERLLNEYPKVLGAPCYEDEHIVVFRP